MKFLWSAAARSVFWRFGNRTANFLHEAISSASFFAISQFAGARLCEGKRAPAAAMLQINNSLFFTHMGDLTFLRLAFSTAALLYSAEF